jgi:beta-lactamase regulating signal transducer with metallopeptidase domain
MISVLNLLLRLSLTGGVASLALLGVSALVRGRLPRAWLYQLWLVVTVSFLVPVPVSLRLPLPQINIPAAYISPTSAAADDTVVVDDTAVVAGVDTTLLAPNPADLPQYENGQEPVSAGEPSGNKIDAYLIVTICWLAVAGGMLLWHIAGYCLTVSRLKKGRALLTADRIPVYESARISTPLLTGLFRPVIYLPCGFKNAELAVRHELCHWRRGDIWSKWLVQLAVCIHWFNPMAHLMKKEMNRLSELSCDEAVIRDMDEGERQVYRQMIVDTLRLSSGLGGLMIAAIGSNKKWLRERLFEIMNKHIVTKKSVAVMVVSVCFIIGTVLLSGGLLSACTTTPTASPAETTSPLETLSSPAPAETLSSSAPPAGEPTQPPDEPYVMSGKYSEFPHEYLVEKFVPVAPLMVDEQYDRDGQQLWRYFRSFPQFMNTDTVFSDGSAIDAINKYYEAEYKRCIEAAALEKQSAIETADEFFARHTENSAEKPYSSYTTVQYKTAVAGAHPSDYEMYNILNVFSIEDAYSGLGSAVGYLWQRTSCAVFSLKTGAKISLADLFTVDRENYVNRLSDEMYTALKNENHLYTTNANRKEEALKMLKPYITDDTFSLSENGLIIMVEPVGAQNVPATIFSITIPYERIKDIMIPPEDIADIPA